MSSRRFIGFLFVLFLIFFPTKPVWAYPGSVFGGVEEGELFTGSKFAMGAHYDLMLSIYEQSGLGTGFDYHDDFTKLNLSDEPRLKQFDFKIPALSMAYSDDRILDQKKGSMTFLYNGLMADGTYFNNFSDIQSRLTVGYKLSNMMTQLIFSQDDFDAVLNNFEWKQQFNFSGNIFETDYQNNQYKNGTDKIVGDSKELFWTPAFGHLRVGTGHFNETSSGVEEDRTRIRADYYHTPTGLNHWKFGGSVEGFYYSSGDQRLELTALSQYRGNWENGGYYQLSYEDIQRTGQTPFAFDDDPVHTSDATLEMNWQIGNNNTDASFKYDFTESKWDQVNGYTEIPIGGNYSLLWVAQYYFDNLYNPEQTTYLLELKHEGSFILSNRLEWNYRLSMLEVSTKSSISLQQDRLDMEISYSFFYKTLDVLKLNYTIYQMGQLTLKCEFERDRFMLIYTWL